MKVLSKFKDGKEYVFSKFAMQQDSSDIIEDNVNNRWINACDGKFVNVCSEQNGTITVRNEKGNDIIYNILPNWCYNVKKLEKHGYFCTGYNIFNAKQAVEECVDYIKDWFYANGRYCNAIVGISGGKDSSIVANLCVKALGKNRVIGVLMPRRSVVDKDLEDGLKLVNELDIKYVTINVGNSTRMIEVEMKNQGINVSEKTIINLPARVRMSTLYAVAQSCSGRVANTCNYSEDYVGYSTRYGDSVGDFSPISHFTVTELLAMGAYLDIPNDLLFRVPNDGLCGKTDEESLGFSYSALDKYIRTGECNDLDVKRKIEILHESTFFKRRPMNTLLPDKEKLYL